MRRRCESGAKWILIALLGSGATLWTAAPLEAQVNTLNLQMTLQGTAQGRPPNEFQSRFVGPLAQCYTASVRDPSTDAIIGTGTDCLEDPLPDGVPDNLRVKATTFFRVSGVGTIVTRGIVSVRRLNPESSSTMTHGTTFYPPRGSDNVLFASGDFSRYRDGRMILRGVVNMNRFLTENTIRFDCHFVVKPPGR